MNATRCKILPNRDSENIGSLLYLLYKHEKYECTFMKQNKRHLDLVLSFHDTNSFPTFLYETNLCVWWIPSQVGATHTIYV